MIIVPNGRIVPYRCVPFGVYYIIRRRLCVARFTISGNAKVFSGGTSNSTGPALFLLNINANERMTEAHLKLWLLPKDKATLKVNEISSFLVLVSRLVF